MWPTVEVWATTGARSSILGAMISPLETLPGWPEAPEVSNAFMLMLILVGPLLVGVVVALLVFAPQLARRAGGSKELSRTGHDLGSELE